MPSEAIVLAPAQRSAPLEVLGTQITILTSAQDAGGREVTIQSGEEGTGPPPHSHVWDESFYVLSGQIAFTCDGDTVMCSEGTFVHVPAGCVHSFSYGPGGGLMLEITEGGRAAALFRKLSEKIPPGPPELPRIVEVLERNGARIHLKNSGLESG